MRFLSCPRGWAEWNLSIADIAIPNFLNAVERGTTQQYEDDIVYRDSAFVRWAEGRQHGSR